MSRDSAVGVSGTLGDAAARVLEVAAAGDAEENADDDDEMRLVAVVGFDRVEEVLKIRQRRALLTAEV